MHHYIFLAPEASDHGEGACQGDEMEEWVHGVLTRMTRLGRQYVWAQGEWNLVLDALPHTDHHDMMAQHQNCTMITAPHNDVAATTESEAS